jgi:hypothetical protein
LIAVRDAEQPSFGEMRAGELEPDRQSVLVEPARDGERRQAGERRRDVKTSPRYIWTGSSLLAPSLNAVVGAVGPRMRSHFWKACAKSRATSRRTFCACR